ncbi:hypothetical protein Adeg_0026 [Ammonifex degensii KC4]|uniref:Uncharacterized protein n=1 Tax=Ammonifex degensii (strain DSM 10501 / KC4) TaxID=429009 RepID=C9RA94_AMMDK|nr:hypothetical protein Adeg_0026 [Ammonifex degensii KC4]
MDQELTAWALRLLLWGILPVIIIASVIAAGTKKNA